MNNISIVGRLTRDVELSTTASGISLARFTVAVNSDVKNANGEREVDFFSCVAWRNTAENIAKFFKKGSFIGVIGSMNSRTYETSKGEKKIIWELNVKGFSFAGEKQKEEKEEIQLEEIEEDDDFPF